MGPKVSKGRPESPLVAPAGAKFPVRAGTYRATCKNDKAKVFVNGMRRRGRTPSDFYFASSSGRPVVEQTCLLGKESSFAFLPMLKPPAFLKRQGVQTVKKPSGGVGGAAAPLTFLRVSRLCRLRGSLILLAKSIPYKFGRPLVDRICFLEKVASATFSTR